MKIAIDIRAAIGKKAGKGWYTYHLVKELLRLDRKNQYILYTNHIGGDAAVFHNAHIKIIHAPAWRWHFAAMKDWLTNEDGGHGVFFAPTSFIIPALLPKATRSMVTVHDLVAFLSPTLHQTKATIIEMLFMRMALRKTSTVLVPSNNTAHDLAQKFGYRYKTAITPLGVDESFFKKPSVPFDTLQKKYGLHERYILTVGGLEPRKNNGRLVESFTQFAKKHTNVQLVIIGGKGWKAGTLEKKLHNTKAAGIQIKHIEHCPQEDIPAMYHYAHAFVFPSLYEGFGLPILEALASGTPTACSKSSSLPEVGGKAVIYFDPLSVDDMANALEKICTDEDLRGRLRIDGPTRAQQFSWKKTAAATLAALQKLKNSRLTK